MFRSCRYTVFLLPLLLAACKHPLQMSGQGDIIELVEGLRGCSVEELEAGLAACSSNEVLVDEELRYYALPRSGWAFSHWENGCKDAPQDPECPVTYSQEWAEAIDENYPDFPGLPLKAVFVESNEGPGVDRYIGSAFGISDNSAFSSLLDTSFYSDRSFRHTTQQASTRTRFDRWLYGYERLQTSIMTTRAPERDTRYGGTMTRDKDLVTLVDTDNSNADVSVTLLTPKLDDGKATLFSGTYYCGSAGTNGHARYFRVIASGGGSGVLTLIQDRLGADGQTPFTYSVEKDGTMVLDYPGAHLVGSISEDGGMFVASQLQTSDQGLAMCIRASSNQFLGTVQGNYYGAFASTQPAFAITDWLVDGTGAAAESIVRDSFGGGPYVLQAESVLVLFDGRISSLTRNGADSRQGAISADGRIAYMVDTRPGSFPTLTVYVRKSL